jgi:hypothetical protein
MSLPKLNPVEPPWYGPVCPVVGEGRHREVSPYPDHREDMAGNAARLAAARRHVPVDGLAAECGIARGDPERFPALLAAHAETAALG